VRVGTVEAPGITVGGTGNPTLQPEVSTEFEGGFESSMFANRLQLEFTGYSKTTSDAIVSQRLAPSLGVTTTRLVNLGKVENKGIEALATVTILDQENIGWDATLTGSSNRNRVIDLGKGIQPILFGFNSTQQHRNGYPLGGYFERKIVSYQDLNGDGIISRVNCPTYAGTSNPQLFGGPACEVVLSDSVEYLGSPIPTREASVATGLTLFKYARLTGLLNYRGGYKIFNSTNEFRCSTVLNCRELYDPSTPLDAQAKVVARFMGNEVGFIEDASFVKLREIALDLTAPAAWASRVKASNIGLTLAARNLATWTDYTGLDPEVNSNAGTNFTTSDFLAQPPVRYFVARLNLNF
jgi:TonB-dependent starch-binding outer membrane protein SusC